MRQNATRLQHPKGDPTCNTPPQPQQAALDPLMMPVEERFLFVRNTAD